MGSGEWAVEETRRHFDYFPLPRSPLVVTPST